MTRASRVWVSGRALCLHVSVTFLVAGFLVLGWWQLQRALSGNELSWAYTVEWPLLAAVAVVGWWHLLAAPPELRGPLEVYRGRVAVGGTVFERFAYDRRADILYLRVDADLIDVEAGQTPEGHRIRVDGRGRLVGLTLRRAREQIGHDGHVLVTIPLNGGAQQIEIEPASLVAALAAVAPSVSAALTTGGRRRSSFDRSASVR